MSFRFVERHFFLFIKTIAYEAFINCEKLTSIIFKGTVKQWNAVWIGTRWNEGVPATKVVCSNGEVAL